MKVHRSGKICGDSQIVFPINFRSLPRLVGAVLGSKIKFKDLFQFFTLFGKSNLGWIIRIMKFQIAAN